MRSFMPIILILVSLAMYFLYINPLLSDISEQKITLGKYQDLLQKAKDLKTRRDAALRSYNNIPTADINNLNKIIPEKFDSIVFLNELSAALTKYGLTLQEFNANQFREISRDPNGGESNAGLYKTITLNMKIVGQYDQFVRFLKDFELNLQLVDLTSLSINASTLGGEAKATDNNLNYSLEFNTYTLN